MQKTNTILAGILVLFIAIAFVLNAKLASETPTTFNYKNQNNQDTQVKAQYKNITVDQLKAYKDNNKDIFLLDVHIPEQKHIKGTDEFIPYNKILENKAKLPKDKDIPIVVYCRSGSMSRKASETLTKMGYTNVQNLVGGINAWRSKGYE